MRLPMKLPKKCFYECPKNDEHTIVEAEILFPNIPDYYITIQQNQTPTKKQFEKLVNETFCKFSLSINEKKQMSTVSWNNKKLTY